MNRNVANRIRNRRRNQLEDSDEDELQEDPLRRNGAEELEQTMHDPSNNLVFIHQ